MTLVALASGMREAALPLMAGGIQQYGWRTWALILAVATLVLGGLLSLIMRHKPESYGYLPDGEAAVNTSRADPKEPDFTLRRAMTTRSFWALALALALGAAATSVATAHWIPFLAERGTALKEVLPLSYLPLVAIAATLVFGYLGDLVIKRYLLALGLVLSGLNLALLMVYPGLFPPLSSLVWGATPLMLAIRADYFGRGAFATIAASMIVLSELMVVLLDIALRAFLGWSFGLTRSYYPTFGLLLVLCLVTAWLFFLAKPPPRPSQS